MRRNITMQAALLGCLLLNLTVSAAASDAGDIHRLLERQQQDWNRGDITAFMTGYEQGDALIFTSGGQIRRGWNETLQRYRKTYPDTRSMGTLKFSDLEIRLVGSSAAVVLGRWELTRENDHPHGVFTLVLKKGAEGWKIIHDHTSSAP